MSHPFSNEVPDLLQPHLTQLMASAVSLEVIKERGYKSILGKNELFKAHFSRVQQRVPGMLIPLHGPEGTIIGYQYRPDHPREDKNRQRLIKYENPAGSSVRLDIPPRCREQLGNPNTPLWITEGIKKVDALATAGACAIGLTGVWGFKGKNLFNGTTILADFDYIAFKGRQIYTVFDSDSSTNPQVNQALCRLAEHLERKGARVCHVQLPAGQNGGKVGADDYLAQGHTLEHMLQLVAIGTPGPAMLPQREHQVYVVEDNRICWSKRGLDGEVLIPLCNFNAKVIEDIIKDDGLETTRFFKVMGTGGNGTSLPVAEVSAASFNSLAWVTSSWGMKSIIAAGQNTKDRLREAIQLQSQDVKERNIFTHTGWRVIDGKPAFLHAAGAIGTDGVEIELDSQLQRYRLENTKGDISEAVKASLGFIDIGILKVTLPLWAAMYLAPLSEILDPAFTLWYCGPTGAFKSTLTALALCHFGDFDYKHLPASWRDTANLLEKLLFLAKDLPLVIDDWAPGQDSSKARELESKAEYIIRAQGNRQGRGRMRPDTSSRPNYIPRGFLITSGEQLPSGHSHTARIFTVELEKGNLDKEQLTEAQHDSHLYRCAMAGYIAWLAEKWDEIKPALRKEYLECRGKVVNEELHPRLPEAIALLYTGLCTGVKFAVETGAMTQKQATALMEDGWAIFVELAQEQGTRVNEERPAKRFIEALRAALNMGTAMLRDKNETVPKQPAPHQTPIGWDDYIDGYILLDPLPVYQVVVQYYQRAGDPFTIKREAVWQDLRRMGYITNGTERHSTSVERVDGKAKRVLRLKRSVIEEVDGH